MLDQALRHDQASTLDQALRHDQASTLDHALRHYWHPVAVSEEVTAEPRQVRLLGENIVVYRDAEGLVALRDKCVHRGVALSGGCIRDGLLMCPYHGWQYDRTGKVAFIPALGDKGSIPSQARVHRYNVREAYGAVWVAPDTPVADLPPWPDDDWNSGDWHVFMVGTWRWQSSAGRMMENAIDFAHFNFVHEGFTELADGPFIKPFEIEVTDDGMTYAYDDGVLVRGLHAASALHAARPQVGGGRHRRGHLVRTGRVEGRRHHHHHIRRLTHRPGRDADLRVPVPQPLLRPSRLRLRGRVPRGNGAGPHGGRSPGSSPSCPSIPARNSTSNWPTPDRSSTEDSYENSLQPSQLDPNHKASRQPASLDPSAG